MQGGEWRAIFEIGRNSAQQDASTAALTDPYDIRKIRLEVGIDFGHPRIVLADLLFQKHFHPFPTSGKASFGEAHRIE